jgi:excisionase family DNA binding protein
MRVLATPLPGEDDPFLTVEEIAVLARVSKMTVYRAIHTGELDGVRFGRSFRIRTSAYDKWASTPGTKEES